MAEGEFPKIDGDILYSSELNTAMSYPRVLYNSSGQTFTFTPTFSGTSFIHIQSRGSLTDSASVNANITLQLSGAVYGAANEDVISVNTVSSSASNNRIPFFLHSIGSNFSSGVSIAGSILNSDGTIGQLKTIILEYPGVGL